LKKENTLNEEEQREAVHSALTAKGIKVTKTLVDQVIDTQNELLTSSLIAGQGIKVRGLGTLEVRPHSARNYKVPKKDASGVPIPGQFLTGVTPAGVHVEFVESDALLDAMNI